MQHFEWFHKGGLLMWPLLGCSVLGMAAILDRLWLYIKTYINFREFIQDLKVHLRSRNRGSIPNSLKNKEAPVAKITKIYYEYLNYPPKKRNEALRREGAKDIENMSKRLRLLSSIAQVSPLLGLMGTVTGLVGSFYNIETLGGRVQPSDLAGGIWEALITTVAGLCVGIPCLLAYQYFQALIDKRAHQMTETVSELDEVLHPECALEPDEKEAHPLAEFENDVKV